jgi:hypothetical protein
MGPTAISFKRSNAMQSLRDGPSEANGRGMTRTGVAIAVLGFAAALAGCSPGVPFDDPVAEYTQRSLTVSPTSGNAQAANLAIQTSTPWPRYSQYTRIPGNGSRLVRAVQNYESGTSGGPPSSAGDPSIAAAPGAPAPSPPTPPPAN